MRIEEESFVLSKSEVKILTTVASREKGRDNLRHVRFVPNAGACASTDGRRAVVLSTKPWVAGMCNFSKEGFSVKADRLRDALRPGFCGSPGIVVVGNAQYRIWLDAASENQEYPDVGQAIPRPAGKDEKGTTITAFNARLLDALMLIGKLCRDAITLHVGANELSPLRLDASTELPESVHAVYILMPMRL